MDAGIKARWVEALRSGEYEQTRSVLVRLDELGGRAVGFCCLGVLCDLAEKDGVVTSRPFHPNENETVRAYGNDLEHALLPSIVQVWAGIDSRSPQVSTPLDEGLWDEYGADHLTTDLAEMNDGGVSFEQIADLIEAQL